MKKDENLSQESLLTDQIVRLVASLDVLVSQLTYTNALLAASAGRLQTGQQTYTYPYVAPVTYGSPTIR